MAKTKTPTGLVISRSNDTKFTLGWRIKDKNHSDGQQVQYKLDTPGSNDWKPKKGNIGKTSKSKSYRIDKSNYYPNNKKPKLLNVLMRVRGNCSQSGDKWSDWEECTFPIETPYKPKADFELGDQENIGTFNWEVKISDSNHKIHTRVKWETILVKDCNEPKGEKQPWGSDQLGYETGTSTAASGSKEITEDSSLFSVEGYSYTRWFRICSQGPRGDSKWFYAKHVYSTPNETTNVNPEDPDEENGTYIIPISWTAPADNQFPIDQAVVQYTFQKPYNVDLDCPTTGIDWNDAAIIKDTKDLDGSVISIDRTVDKDECLYIRVDTYHDTKVTHGKAVLTKIGYLKDPSNISVVTNDSNHKATVTATNNSEVTSSVLGIIYQGSSGKEVEVGVIPHGSTSATVQCPNWDDEDAIAFKVYAYVGVPTTQTIKDEDGVTIYTAYSSNARMKSENAISEGGAVPKAPTGVSARRAGIDGTVRVEWNWDWAEASGAELSWSDHEDAWESTDEPSVFEVSTIKASYWNISDLELGKIWYIRVRLFKREGESTTFGPYSNIVPVKLLSAPDTPALSVSRSDSIVSPQGSTVVRWVYVSTDTTSQSFAQLVEVTQVDGSYQYREIGTTETAQHLRLDIESLGWEAGIHDIVLRVKSESGVWSDWSNMVSITVAPDLVCSVVNPFSQRSIIDDDGEARVVDSLVELPLSVEVSGVDDNGETTIVIERAETYKLDRPDERRDECFKGETVCILHSPGSGTVDIEPSDVYGSLDDGAQYNLIVTMSNELGQSSEPVEIPFEVHWDHQADKPSYRISIDEANRIARITPRPPADVAEGDVCDIYRLSVDKPELIYSGAEFNTEYVDPYPTLGQFGGYRLVTRTSNGDYTTSKGYLAETNTQGDGILPNPEEYNIIDFDGEQIVLYYDSSLSSSWEKDFKETRYLGGSIQGDWNPGVKRSNSLSSLVITTLDQDLIQSLHRLAVYAGICHVRTSDGGSYSADIQVSKTVDPEDRGMRESYSLDITRVESQGFDAIPGDEWEA